MWNELRKSAQQQLELPKLPKKKYQTGKPLYHGTDADIDRFRLTEGNRAVSLIGDIPYKVMNNAVFLTPSKAYARTRGNKIYKAMLRPGKYLDLTKGFNAYNYQLQNVEDENTYKHVGHPIFEAIDASEFYFQSVMDGYIQIWELVDDNNFVNVLKGYGYDGIVFNEPLTELSDDYYRKTFEGKGNVVTYAVFDPDNIIMQEVGE